MSKPDVKKIREMLAYFPHAPLRYDTRSWKCFDNEGTVLFEFKPWDKSGCRFEDLAMFSLFSSAPTLLREACEYIEALEELHEIVRWEKECEDFQRPPSRKFQTHLGHLSWLDAKKAKDNWKSNGWRSLARIYGNAWMQKQDALSDLDKQEASDAQDR